MAAFLDFGDAEAATCDILRAASQVSAFAPVTVSTDRVGYTTPARWIRVHRTGGLPTLYRCQDNPTVEFEVYAETKAAARDLAGAARGAVYAAQGTYAGQGLTLCDVDEKVGLAWAPDERDAARYTFTLTLVTQPG